MLNRRTLIVLQLVQISSLIIVILSLIGAILTFYHFSYIIAVIGMVVTFGAKLAEFDEVRLSINNLIKTKLR